MPEARLVFLSATPIPDAKSFAYLANRLGLAGESSMFATALEAAESASDNTRIAELLVAEGVSLGTIATGGLSFEGVTYSTTTTRTTDAQRAVLDHYSSIITHALDYARARLERYSNLNYDAARFDIPTSSQLTMLANLAMKTILMDICRPALFDAIDAARARGESVVIEVARTGEAARKAAEADGLLQVASSGKHMISQLIRLLSLPVNVRTIIEGEQRILVDRNPERTNRTTANFERALGAVVEDDHILTDLATRYGSRFAEITGRAVRTMRVNGELVTVPRKPGKDNKKAIKAFADGDVDIVAVSEAGSRGIDLHASAAFANRGQRNLFVFDPFLSPAEFTQIMGRVCRTGQVSWPKVGFFTTDIPALSANLGRVVAKMREAGACTYGERDSIRVQADTLSINNVGFGVVTRLLDTMKQDTILGSYHGSAKFSTKATIAPIITWGATLPSCNRIPAQQRFWHHLSTICEDITLKTVDERVYRSDRQIIKPTTINGYPGSVLELQEPDQFVRSWQSVAQAMNGIEDTRWLMTAEGITCAFPLPVFAKNDQAYRVLQPRGARVEYSLPLGTDLTFEEARVAWNAAVDAIPRRKRRLLVAHFPIGPLVAHERQVARETKRATMLPISTLSTNTHTFVDRSGAAVFGLYLSHRMRDDLKLGNDTTDAIAS